MIRELASCISTTPATSVEAKRTLTASGLFLTKLRCRLSDKSLDMLFKGQLETSATYGTEDNVSETLLLKMILIYKCNTCSIGLSATICKLPWRVGTEKKGWSSSMNTINMFPDDSEVILKLLLLTYQLCRGFCTRLQL